MFADTERLIQRSYATLVDDILTAVIGGVVNEPILFDIKVASYPLAEPASAVRGVTGVVADEPHTFLPEIDFGFSPATNVLSWLDDGTRPDDDTTFLVDYARVDSRSPLTDITVGSVTRTLTEAIGREIATVYAQIQVAYESGFIDTATGASLDHVVAILDVIRKTAEFAEGLVTFFRAAGVDGNITIPAGTRLTTTTGDVVFVTASMRTLQRGQERIDVPVRADVGFAGEAGIVAAGAITEVSQPIAGISRVTNLDPTIRAAADETDDELRARAKAALRSLGKATLAALDRVIREGRGTPLEFFDPNSPVDHRSPAGTVTVVVDADPERLPSLRAAVHETRAAGVLATVLARYVFATPRLRITVPDGIAQPGREQIARDVVDAIRDLVDGLGRGEPLDGAALRDTVTGVDDVTSASIRDVVVARADLTGDVSAPAGVAAAGSGPPTDARIPDRSLLQSTAPDRAGQPATDEEIEAGTFAVSATVDGEAWWVALDMTVSDVDVRIAGEEASGAEG